MGKLSVLGKVFKVLSGPLGVLEDWAQEPLKMAQNHREQSNRDREVERQIRLQTGVESVKSQLRKEENEQQTNLEIRMKTEIARINAETEQWTKDQDFKRMKCVAESVVRYRQQLTDLQVNTISAIANMDIELREKAQDLILSKTKEYKALQDQAHRDAEDELERIIEKFSGNQRVMDIMIGSAEKKLACVVDSATQFMQGLQQDIQRMNENIDMITKSGQDFIDRQVESKFNSISYQGVNRLSSLNSEE